MSEAVADLLLRCAASLADEGVGPMSYSSVMGPDRLPTDDVLWTLAADITGRENITHLDARDFLGIADQPPHEHTFAEGGCECTQPGCSVTYAQYRIGKGEK
jgi:hypothetical protein